MSGGRKALIIEAADFVSEQPVPNEPLPAFCHALTRYEYITSEKVLRISGLSIKMKKIRIISIFSLTNAGIYDILISVIITDFIQANETISF